MSHFKVSTFLHRALPLSLAIALAGCGTNALAPLSSRGASSAFTAASSHSNDFMARVFKQADVNRDGKLSPSEADLSAAQFKALDQNGDGFLSANEWNAQLPMSQVYQALPAFRPAISDLFQRLDANHDGRVSKAELDQVLGDHPTQLALQPGVVTPAFNLADAAHLNALDQAQFEKFYLNLGGDGAAPATDKGIFGSIGHILLAPYITLMSHIATKEACFPARKALATTPAIMGMAFQNVSFQTKDGIPLAGWYIPAAVPTDKVIVAVHGHGDNRCFILNDKQLAWMHTRYNVLTFDLQGHGVSGGNGTTFGYYEGDDVLAAVQFAESQGNTSVGLYGVSEGGASVLRGTALTAHDAAVKAVVDDCSYATVQLAFYGFIAHLHVPFANLVAAATVVNGNQTFGIDMTTTEPVTQMAAIAPKPLFVIHGAADPEIDPKNSQMNYNAASNDPNKQIWFVPGAGHAESVSTDPVDYANKVMSFFGAAMP